MLRQEEDALTLCCAALSTQSGASSYRA